MALHEGKRKLESIPVGKLGVVALSSCEELGKKVDKYLVDWRTERENEHKNTLAFSGYLQILAFQDLLTALVIAKIRRQIISIATEPRIIIGIK